ncbi:MAG: aspartyl/asparaginyl beta-hydroxylase domain-containing protein [Sulfuricellaceae bacterium]|nr:aspartyl/asparaginyl beta-hydroxylase domain-containing protein [Sulfuricellaceae bacterium]
MSTLYDLSTGLIRRIYDSRISDPPILDSSARFPEARRFVDAWPLLRDEALRLAENIVQIPRFHELMAEQADISAKDGRDWRMFVLKAYGASISRNMALCPELAARVEEVPDVLSATLSFLAPHKHIPQHRGPFRGVLRFYLGLSVPTGADGRPSTVLKIDGAEHRIADGECLLWDDTFPHEVWNRSEAMRIALLLDVRRRGMPPDMELLSRLLIGAAGTAVRLRRLA